MVFKSLGLKASAVAASSAFVLAACSGGGARLAPTYMPQTAPHWVKNGDEVSITASFTYYTNATRRRALLHRGNEKLRSLGLTPAPVGHTPVVDSVKHLAFQAQQQLKNVVNSARGKPTLPSTSFSYAPTP